MTKRLDNTKIKLQLNKQTLRVLSETEAAKVAGGYKWDDSDGEPTCETAYNSCATGNCAWCD